MNRVLIDIKRKESSTAKISPQVNPTHKNLCVRINLSYCRILRFPAKRIATIFIVGVVFLSFIFNFAAAPTNGGAYAAQDPLAERQSLEAQLTQLEQQIDEYDGKVQEYKKQGDTLQSEIKKYNDKIAKLNLQIKAITLTLKKLNDEMNSTTQQISDTEVKIGDKKKVIADILQNIYQNENRGTLTIFLANVKISDFFNEMSRLASVQDKLRVNMEELGVLHSQLSDQKQTLALEKQDNMNLIEYQQGQKLDIQKTKDEKNTLLKETKGKESEYQKILTQTQETAAQIRNRLFELIGGGELKFEDAYKLAQFAESKTGVRAALILAVLDKESALGKNVGKCNYKTAMHPTRDIPIFLEITSELKLNPDTTLVSCPITRDGAYGGAMGPAQFIPSTWVRFNDQIAALTGDNPPSPWNNTDAFMATALYLKSVGADGGTLYAEKVAAAKYYAGGRWSYYLSSYGANVIARASQFEQDIATLNA